MRSHFTYVTLLRSVVLSCLAVLTARAQNFSGKWTWTTQAGRGSSSRVLVLNQAGKDVSGTITPQDSMWTTGPFGVSIRGAKVSRS